MTARWQQRTGGEQEYANTSVLRNLHPRQYAMRYGYDNGTSQTIPPFTYHVFKTATPDPDSSPFYFLSNPMRLYQSHHAGMGLPLRSSAAPALFFSSPLNNSNTKDTMGDRTIYHKNARLIQKQQYMLRRGNDDERWSKFHGNMLYLQFQQPCTALLATFSPNTIAHAARPSISFLMKPFLAILPALACLLVLVLLSLLLSMDTARLALFLSPRSLLAHSRSLLLLTNSFTPRRSFYSLMNKKPA